MKQAHLFISGFVQGVGFRQFIAHQAGKLGIVGWVRNLPDGRVEIVAHGRKSSIEELIRFCRKGPMLAEVEDVIVEWEENTEKFNSFETC